MKPIGPTIRAYMKENEIKVADVAEKSGFSGSQLSQMLSRPTLDAEKLERICRAIGLSPMTFFEMDDDAKIVNYSDLKDVSGITNIGNAAVNIGDSAIARIMKEKDKLLAEKDRLLEEKERTIRILMRQAGLEDGA